ncbi:ubiquitin carboxyl-terminal hydrolase BAP1 [Platysternon megacephalum]|uniref:Ubiquitin carboxyl-terminal hydrolase BAP1 n=1 Tax=Platysternon megacephalum TaxID=55544 RepID=A0A4D9E5H3_9SAUR|nr:ubiquitin carboxyl-terminal hydrolase BAP1 [Platysternon megacephalum]
MSPHSKDDTETQGAGAAPTWTERQDDALDANKRERERERPLLCHPLCLSLAASGSPGTAGLTDPWKAMLAQWLQDRGAGKGKSVKYRSMVSVDTELYES